MKTVKVYLLFIFAILLYPFLTIYYTIKEAKYMRKFNKWISTKMTANQFDKNGRIKWYNTNLCPKCQKESIIQTNYCPRCGKRLKKGMD